MRRIALTLFLIALLSYTGYGQRIISYGFEDWTGSHDTAPNYIFSTDGPSYWTNHKGDTIVTGPSPGCGNRTAHSGSYYLHRQFYTGAVDPCLGHAAPELNDHNNIGFGGAYPLGSGNKTRLAIAVTGNTATIRFYCRATDVWGQSAVNWGKIIRWNGVGGAGALLQAYPTTGSNTGFFLYDDLPGYRAAGSSGVSYWDGSWHPLAMRLTIVAASAPNNLYAEVWSNWDMSGEPFVASHMTTGFNDWVSICLFQNWGATNPSSLMGIDIDDIEVWNGTPGQGPAAPASLRIVRAALEPFQPLVLPSLAEGWLALLRAWNWCLGLAA